MRRVLPFLLLAALALPGCGPQIAPPEPVTIQFAVEEGDEEPFESFLAPFKEKHPEITVELQPDRNEETDCFIGLPFDLPGDVENSALLALDPFFEQAPDFKADDFYPGAVDVLKYQGKTWGIPAGVDPIMMYYNKRLFDAAGVSYPQPGWTWDDFLAAGLAISKPDERVFGYAMPQSADSFDLPVFVYAHDGRLFDDLSNPTAVTFDDPKTIEAVEWYTDLVLRHNIAPTPEQARGFYGGGNQGIFRGVYEGKFGLWSGFFTDRGGRTWPVEWVEPWGMVTMPRDANDATLGPVLAYFLIADQPSPDACWQWVTFLSEQTAPGLAPARRTLAESDAFAQEVGAEQAAAVRSALDNAIFISPQAARAGEALPAFGNAVREVLSGKTTVEEALLAAQQQAENALPQQ